ncbi:hypothetical protein HOB87_04495 [Candidatus Woesearchaeota archaeon]|jgi:hypothetical protein|nr:hypothetical protein [Candidatus Woesearchaeota archaeon]
MKTQIGLRSKLSSATPGYELPAQRGYASDLTFCTNRQKTNCHRSYLLIVPKISRYTFESQLAHQKYQRAPQLLILTFYQTLKTTAFKR